MRMFRRTELNLPADLYDAMKSDAHLARRSLNAHITFVLEWWLTSKEAREVRAQQRVAAQLTKRPVDEE